MNTNDASANFDLALIIAMPIQGVTYTPQSTPRPEGSVGISTLSETERKLYHFMIACEFSQAHFTHEAESRDLRYKGLMYTNTDPVERARLKKQIDEDKTSSILLERKSNAVCRLFWNTLRIRLNSTLPVGYETLCVYGDNEIGCLKNSPDEEEIEFIQELGDLFKKYLPYCQREE